MGQTQGDSTREAPGDPRGIREKGRGSNIQSKMGLGEFNGTNCGDDLVGRVPMCLKCRLAQCVADEFSSDSVITDSVDSMGLVWQRRLAQAQSRL